MKYIFIVNPAAGNGSLVKNKLDEKIKVEAEKAGIPVEIHFTSAAGDAPNIVKRIAEEYPNEEIAFYACGGDGTLCEVVNGVMALGDVSRFCVGTLPSGTGNDFVRNFTAPERFFDIPAQLSAEQRYIDIVKCNDLYSVNMINIGFDCEVVCKKGEFQKHKFLPSKLAYIFGLVATLVKKPGACCRISIDGGEYREEKLLLMTYANGEYCGGGFHSNPLGHLFDGSMDILFVNNITRRRFISIVGTYKKGTHLKHTDIIRNQKASTVDIDFEKNTNISIDGEIVSADKLHLEVENNKLRFLIPDGCKYEKAVEKKKEAAEIAV